MKIKGILLGSLLMLVIGISTAAINYSSIGIAPYYAANIVVEQTKYDPFPAIPGEYVKVWIKVDNWGGEDLRNLQRQVEENGLQDTVHLYGPRPHREVDR